MQLFAAGATGVLGRPLVRAWSTAATKSSGAFYFADQAGMAATTAVVLCQPSRRPLKRAISP